MRKLLVMAIAMLALTAACSSDDPATSESVSPNDQPVATASPAASGDATTADGECQDDTKADGPADLEMQDFVFAPPCLLITTAQGLRIHNEGENEHNFSVDGFGLDVDVSPGDENNTEATGLEPGSYTIFCKYHRESNDMEGKLLVKSA